MEITSVPHLDLLAFLSVHNATHWLLPQYNRQDNVTNISMWTNRFTDTDAVKNVDVAATVFHYLNLCLIPLIVFVGAFANGLSVVVFLCTHLREQSSSIYLAFLAIVDSLHLIVLFLGWFSWIGIFLTYKPVICGLSVYLSYVTSFLSVWFVVAFTVERYIVVLYPFRRVTMCTVNRAKYVILALAIFALLFYSYILVTHRFYEIPYIKIATCSSKPEYIGVVRAMTYTDTSISLVIPSLVIIVLNIRIGYHVYNVMHTQRRTSDGNCQTVMRGALRCNYSIFISTTPPRVEETSFTATRREDHSVRENEGASGLMDNSEFRQGSIRKNVKRYPSWRTRRSSDEAITNRLLSIQTTDECIPRHISHNLQVTSFQPVVHVEM